MRTGPTATLAAILPALLCWSAAAGEGSSPGEALAKLSARIGGAPDFCARIGEQGRVCTWHHRRQEHVVCAFGLPALAQELMGETCLRTPDNENMQTFRVTRSRKGARRYPDRKQQRTEARAALDRAERLADVIRLVGAGPRWCAADGSGPASLACSWHLVRRTPGYNLFGRAANAPGKKLNLLCSFPGPLEPRAAGDACSIEEGGAPSPAPR